MKMQNLKFKIIFLSAIFAGVFGLAQNSQAATYYVDASAADNNGTGSESSPKKYIESGINLMSSLGGDTLVIKDGTYSTANDQVTNIPNGQAGVYNIIKAEHDGGVIITASGGLQLAHTNAYIQIEGIKFAFAEGKGILGNHIKFFRCSFSGAEGSDNRATVTVGVSDYNDTSYILLEDCWSYGLGGRYNIQLFNADHIVLRRVVCRHDGGWDDYIKPSDPEACIAVYNCSYVELQNCIAVDSDLETYHTFGRSFYTIWNAGSPGAGGVVHDTDHVNWTGCMAINTKGQCWESDGTAGHNIESTYTDCVGYDPAGYGIIGGSSNGQTTLTINRMTLGSGANQGCAGWDNGSMTIANSIVTGFTTGDFSGYCAASYNDRYSNGNSGSCTSCQTYSPFTSGLLYLPRIEDNGALKTAGSGGGQIGATIVKRMGVSGTLWGETGYNTLTDDNLWPWPNENRIKTDLASVSARGFAASGNDNWGQPLTLTRYIWEYLGNQIPADIYGSSSDVTAPSTPSGLSVS